MDKEMEMDKEMDLVMESPEPLNRQQPEPGNTSGSRSSQSQPWAG